MREMKIIFLIGAILLFNRSLSAEIMDYAVGYNDGCQSAKGDFSRSESAYKTVPAYKEGWQKGKKECKGKASKKAKVKRHKKRRKHYSKKRRVKHYHKKRVRVARAKKRLYRPVATYKCKSNSWLSFSQGWDDGYRSAQGVWTRRNNYCSEYNRGWEEGFNQCKCQELGECVTLATYP